MIQAIIIIEIMGKPPEHILKTMEMLIEKIEEDKDVKILNKEISQPKQLKESEGLFTTFAEIELSFENLISFLNLMFNYTPSHVEIIKPEKLEISNNDLNLLFNQLVTKLHRYDEIVKSLGITVRILEKQLLDAGIKPALPQLQQQGQQQEQEKKGRKKRRRKKN